MNLTIFIPLLFALQALYWAVGRRASRQLETNEDYFLAGKTVCFFPLMMTFLATQVGGGLVLGSAEEAYRHGWPVLLYPLGAALGLIVLGLGMGRKLAQFQVSTVAQILEVVYRSPALKKVASILSVLSLFMILVAQVIASGKFLASIGFTNTPLFIAFWAIVILYTMKGGLKAVISTDLIQAAFFSVIFFLCFGLTYSSSLNLPALQMDSFSAVSPKLCGWLLMPLLFMIIEQDMGQRCFAGGSPRIVSLATFWAGIGTFLVCLVPIFFGVLAKSQGMQAPQGSSILITAIAQLTNPWIAALAGCAILAAIISTAGSLITAISSNLSSDFSKDRSLKSVQLITGAISICAIFFAFYFDNVVDVLIQSYDLSVSCLFIPIVVGLFKKRGHFLSALLSILMGSAAFILFRFMPIPFPRELASIALSGTGFLLGELLAKKEFAIEQKI
jgi:SSS family solute:Na+ symporter